MQLLRLFLVFIIFLPFPVSALTYSQIQNSNEYSIDKQKIASDIFDQIICPATPISHLLTPQLRFEEMHLPNAFVEQNETIVLSNQLLNLTNTTDEIAFIVAHEMGHIAFGHNHESHSIEHEIEADGFALAIMNSSNFDPAAASHIVRKVAGFSLAPGIIIADLYPGISERILHLES